jgi:hypothetical protein
MKPFLVFPVPLALAGNTKGSFLKARRRRAFKKLPLIMRITVILLRIEKFIKKQSKKMNRPRSGRFIFLGFMDKSCNSL